MITYPVIPNGLWQLRPAIIARVSRAGGRRVSWTGASGARAGARIMDDIQVSVGNTGDGGELAMQLKVASTAGGGLTAVPGTWVSSDALIGFGWPARGDSLVAEVSFTTKMQLASWRPGASHPAVQVIRPGSSQASLILG